MSISPKLLEILVCPISKLPVSMLDEKKLKKLNQSIESSNVKNLGGDSVSEPFEEGLITQNNKTIYRIQQGIPIMLEDQAIHVSEIEG